jgi:hypothetical protein
VISPIVIFIVVAVVGLLIVTLLPRRSAPAAGDAACGSCGYSTRGLETLTCPECGEDLRRVGIIPSGGAARRRLGFLIPAIVFTAALLFIGVPANSLLTDLLPLRRTYERTITATSPAGRKYQIIGKASTWSEQRPPLNVTVEMTSGVTRTLTLDPSGRSAFADAAGKTVTAPKRFGQPVVMAWLQSTGVTADQQTIDEAGEIAHLARRASRITQPQLGPGTWTRMGMTGASVGLTTTQSEIGRAELPPAAKEIITGLWLIPWFAGLVFLWRQRNPVPSPGSPGEG